MLPFITTLASVVVVVIVVYRCSIDPDSRTPSPQPPTSDPTSTASGETRFRCKLLLLLLVILVTFRSPYGLQLKICDFGLSQRVPDVSSYSIAITTTVTNKASGANYHSDRSFSAVIASLL